MLKSRRNFRLGVCGAVLGAVYLDLAGSAMAWNEPLWVRQLGIEEDYDSGIGLATDAVGNVYVTGYWLAKYDAAGRVLWRRQFEGGSAAGVATDAVGNVYVSGWTYRLLGGHYSGLQDAWVAKYDTAGHVLWKRQFGTETADDANGVTTDTAGNVYIQEILVSPRAAINTN